MNLQEQDKYQEATDQVASSDNLDNEEQINNSFLHSQQILTAKIEVKTKNA